MTSLFALIDCNNFYASCERVFQPKLNGRPVVVLSNNDGCIIACSNEAKLLMGGNIGQPVHEVRDLIEKHNITVFSSNYTLYGDMSRRVMNTLAAFTPNIEIYSIDEAFLDLGNFRGIDLTDYGRKIKNTVWQHTGIPVSVGIGATKTLAKLASRLAKKSDKAKGVLALTEPAHIEAALQRTAVKSIWGIGRRYARKLEPHGILTAWDLACAPDQFIKKNLSVVGLRTVKELRGEPCTDLEIHAATKKHICTSRSFGYRLTAFDEIMEATANYASQCAAKLRKQKACAAAITVFLETGRNERAGTYFNSKTLALPVASDSTLELVHYAGVALKAIFRETYRYKKCGVIVSALRPRNQVQTSLLDTIDRDKHASLMQTLDTMNRRYGKECVVSAVQGTKKLWQMKREYHSPCYTTRLDELLEVNTDFWGSLKPEKSDDD